VKERGRLEDLDVNDRILKLRDFMPSPRCKRDLRSFGIVRRAERQFLNHVSGQPFVPPPGPSSEFGTDSLSRNVGNKLSLYAA
jgi:hypothetical protein